MHAKGSSSFVPNLHQQRGFDLSQQYVRNQAGFCTDWRTPPEMRYSRYFIRNKISAILSSSIHCEQAKQSSKIANILEHRLFIHAASKEDYMNQETLVQRVQTQLNKMYRTKGTQQQVDSSINNTYKTVPSSRFLHAWSNGSLPEPALQKAAAPAINAIDYCAVNTKNKYDLPKGGLFNTSIVHEPVLSNFSVSGGGCNPEASSKSIISYFPRQHADDLEMDLKKYSCLGTIQKNESMAFHSTMGPLQSESLNLMISQHVSRENLEGSNLLPALMQPYDLCDKASTVQYMLPPDKRLEMESAFGVSLMNNASSDQWTHKMALPYSSEAPFGNSEAMLPPAKRQKMDSAFGVSLMKNASSDQWTHKMAQPYSSEAPPGNSEAMLPPDKILEMESAFCVSFMNNASSDQWTHKMAQPYSSEAPSGNSEAMLPPDKILEVESAFGVSFMNNASSDQWTHKMAQPYSSEALPELQQQSESPPIHSEVTECSAEQFTNSMLDSISIGEIKNSGIDDTFGQSFKRETIPSKGLEVDHISEEPDPKSHNMINSSNLEETVIRLNSSVHTFCKDPIAADIEDIQGKTGFNQAEINGEKKVIEPKADQEKETKTSNTAISEINGLTNCLINNSSSDQWTHKMAQPYASEALSELQQHSESPLSSIDSEVTEFNVEQFTNSMVDSMSISEIKNSAIDDTFRQNFKSETVPSEGLEAGHISEEPDPKSHDVVDRSNLEETVIGSNSNKHTLCEDPIAADIEDIQIKTGSNHAGLNAKKEVSEPKVDQEKETKSSNTTVNIVSLTDSFTSTQIMEHIKGLRKKFVQGISEEETGIAASTCQLCAMEKLFFSPVPIYCLCCGSRIKRNGNYYCKKAEEFDTQHCFCNLCYKNSRGGSITFNGLSVSKTLLDRKRNDEVLEEAWVECNKCKRWQHQICALYNKRRDLDRSAEYICPICRLKEIENGMHVPYPKTAIFGAKDLPRTMLSDHIEKRLFKRLMQERTDRAKAEANKNFDEVLAAENLTVRVVLSVDKQLKVNKQFLDIFLEENYPAEFSYRSKVILLFQQIEGADVCLFGMYVQEFGSECGYPNQRCVYISYLDSVKYFRPESKTVKGEALRTFVYHEILIGYLDFCKKRGFTTCYIWACPPLKGEDYVLYCHPDTQKTPKKDKLRHWYHSMLRKAAEENIVVGLTNIYDHFFVPTEKCDSKITAARLPYFDGDYWSGAAMDLARNIEQESGGECEKTLKLVTKRTLRAMGHVGPSKGTVKDILVMQKLGQNILPVKEDFIIIQLQHTCVHCHKVIVSGKRWFCTECKKFQECERCHTADSHTSVSGEKHILCQVFMDDIPADTRENGIILDNGLFENRNNFLSFCQKNYFQFDTLRRAKYSSMMILYHLKSPTMLTIGTMCSICCKHSVFQQSWKCEICPEFTVCSACYNERGAKSHAHKLSQTNSTALCLSGNEESKQKSVLMQELLEVLQHASQCRSTKTQPCSYPNCLQIKKLFSHASRCTIRVSGGCPYCKKAWLGLTVHSRNCRDTECCIPRCLDLKKHAEWIAMQSESRRRAAVVESIRELRDH